MTFVGSKVVEYAREHHLQVGVNCLANAAIPALAIAKSIGAGFIRVNQFVNAYVANEGFVEGLAGKILRYRKNIDGEDISIFADVHVKHGSHAIVADRPVSEQAKDVLFFSGDVLVCTGYRTGDAPSDEEIDAIKVSPNVPVVAGMMKLLRNWRLLKMSNVTYKFEGPVGFGILPDGTTFLFDSNKINQINDMNWYRNYRETDRHMYIQNVKGKKLHDYLVSCPKGCEVDHINLDTLDNRLCNLRIVTHQQNQINQPLQKNNTSGVSGVSYYPPRETLIITRSDFL